jgi:hypothetical protein
VALARTAADTLLEEILFICRVVWLDAPSRLRQAARIAHGNGLGMAEALILGSLIEAKQGRSARQIRRPTKAVRRPCCFEAGSVAVER